LLQGTIPPEWDLLAMPLQALDLSNNNLTGEDADFRIP
jgi:hypothetical protein